MSKPLGNHESRCSGVKRKASEIAASRRNWEEAEKRKQQHVANVSLGLSRARRGRFLRRVDAVSCASDDVRRVTVRTVRPDEETVVVVTFCFAGR